MNTRDTSLAIFAALVLCIGALVISQAWYGPVVFLGIRFAAYAVLLAGIMAVVASRVGNDPAAIKAAAERLGASPWRHLTTSIGTFVFAGTQLLLAPDEWAVGFAILSLAWSTTFGVLKETVFKKRIADDEPPQGVGA